MRNKSQNVTFCSVQLGDLSTVIDSSYRHWYRHVTVLLHLILQTRVMHFIMVPWLSCM